MVEIRIAKLVGLCLSVLLLVGCNGGSSTTDPTAGEASRVGNESSPEPADRRTADADRPESDAEQVPQIRSLGARVERVEPPARPEPPGIEVVRAYTRQFYDGALDELYARFSEEMQQEVMPRDRLQAFHQFVKQQYGEETELIGEDWRSDDQYRAFVRWASFSKFDGVIEIKWILHEDDTIAGLFVQPARPARSSER